MKNNYIYYLLFILLYIHTNVMGQTTIVSGIVIDSLTKEPLPFVNVAFTNSNIGTSTDFDGKFSLKTSKQLNEVTFSYIGYKTVNKKIVLGKKQVLKIRLSPKAIGLAEVEIKAGKNNYKNKDNPAVTLIKQVIDHKEENRIEAIDFYEYEQYEKIQFAISNVTEQYKSKKMFKKFQFVFENVDTTKLEGKPVLPFYLYEQITDIYYRQSPKTKKEVVKANKAVSFYGMDNSGIDQYLQYLYQDINIYDNNITMLTNQFLSPISNLAPTFYRFYIVDTMMIDSSQYIELAFFPRNKYDLLFQGSLFITTDGSYAVQKVEMTVNEEINLNWVKQLSIRQEFEKYGETGYLLIKDEFSADFGLTDNSKRGIYGQRVISRKDYILNKFQDDNFYQNEIESKTDSSVEKSKEYWEENRHEVLSKSEKGTYLVMDSIQKVPAFKRAMNVATLLLAGYQPLGPIEIGPVSTFYSYNPVEGLRLRLGGRTTDKFSKRINFETYGAYGLIDEKFKYYFGTTYSLTKRGIWDFPVKNLSANYQRDTKIPGQELQFVQEDNILLSIKRGPNDKWLYNNIFNLSYLSEFQSHFSYTIGYKNWKQEPAGSLEFINTSNGNNSTITTSEFNLTLRWAPNEKFYQGKSYRIPIINKYPIMSLRFRAGLKGFLDGEYEYQGITLNIFKRIYLSQLGYSDIVAEAGKIFGKVPFPLLDIHRANQTYSYQLQSYNLMNFLEFVSDQYASINVDHNFNGMIFNKIPLIKKLKLREVATVKVLYGSINAENDPSLDNGLIDFPKDDNGTTITQSLEDKPYIEGSVGIANIFKVFRVDLVKRFTYLDNPDISELGIRARFKFDF